MLKEKVDKLLHDAFEERPDLFLVSCDISTSGDIKVVIDGDDDLKVADCIFVSRAVEHHLDREEYDFSLEVTSAGVGKPLVNSRQYIKNVGRELEVVSTSNEKQCGKLLHVTPEEITLEWQTREAKTLGKGKETVTKHWSIPFNNIKQAKVIITFN